MNECNAINCKTWKQHKTREKSLHIVYIETDLNKSNLNEIRFFRLSHILYINAVDARLWSQIGDQWWCRIVASHAWHRSPPAN